MTHKVGAKVVHNVPVITGTVIDTRWNKDNEAPEHLVAYTKNGEQHERWFPADELDSAPDTGSAS